MQLIIKNIQTHIKTVQIRCMHTVNKHDKHQLKLTMYEKTHGDIQ